VETPLGFTTVKYIGAIEFVEKLQNPWQG
jgi:hypothetical protein